MTETPKDNVHTLEQLVDKEIDRERAKAADTFSALYADYLEARATEIRPGKSDKACDRLCDVTDALIWRIIHTPAPMLCQLDYKFEIMRGLVEAQFSDGRSSAMLESIRADVVGGID